MVLRALRAQTASAVPTGMSAYDVYVANTTDNPVLSQHDWLQSLKGDIGPTGADGKRGQTGMSAYDVYLSTTTDSPVLSQNDWLKSLKGDPGPTGADGKRGPTGMSAYDLYASTTTDSPVLSQSDWLKSLKGAPGPAGAPGADGKRDRRVIRDRRVRLVTSRARRRPRSASSTAARQPHSGRVQLALDFPALSLTSRPQPRNAPDLWEGTEARSRAGLNPSHGSPAASSTAMRCLALSSDDKVRSTC